MITREDYFMGRDESHDDELTPEIEANALVTVARANHLLAYYFDACPDARRCKVNSGWRPGGINAATKGAAVGSKHLTARAIDLSDDGSLWEWCAENLDLMETVGLWMEHRRDTPAWCHWQTVAPGSGRRIFYAR